MVKVEVTLSVAVCRVKKEYAEQFRQRVQEKFQQRVDALEGPLQELLDEFFIEHDELNTEVEDEFDSVRLTFKSASRGFY